MRREPVLDPVRGWHRLRDTWLVLSGQANAMRKAREDDDQARVGYWIPRAYYPIQWSITTNVTTSCNNVTFGGTS
jgi:hypothetical protein